LSDCIYSDIENGMKVLIIKVVPKLQRRVDDHKLILMLENDETIPSFTFQICVKNVLYQGRI